MLESRCLLSATIQGRVWEDANEDKTVDADEQFLNGKQVDLLTLDGRVVASTTTQSFDLDQSGSIDFATETGWYRFEGVDPGRHQIQVNGVSANGQTQPEPTSLIYGSQYRGEPIVHSASGSIFILNLSNVLEQIHFQSKTKLNEIELGSDYQVVTMSPDQRTLAAVGADWRSDEILVQLIDGKTHERQTFRSPANGWEWFVRNASWMKDGSIVLTTAGGPSRVSQSIILYDVANDVFQRVTDIGSSHQTLTSFDRGRFLTYPVWGGSGPARMYDANTQTWSVVPPGVFDDNSLPLAFNREGSLILRDGLRQSVLDQNFNETLKIDSGTAFGFSPVDGNLLGYSDSHGSLQRIDVSTGFPLQDAGKHPENLRTPFATLLSDSEFVFGHDSRHLQGSIATNGQPSAASILVVSEDNGSHALEPIGLKPTGHLLLNDLESVEIQEGDAGVTAKLALGQRPISDVVIRANVEDSARVRAIPETIRFTPDNWQTPQQIFLQAVDDDTPEFGSTSVVTFRVDRDSSAPEFYHARDVAVDVMRLDNDRLISGQVKAEEGASDAEGLNGVTMDLLGLSGEVLQSTVTQSYDVNQDGEIDPGAEQGIYQFVVDETGDYFVSHRGIQKSATYYDLDLSTPKQDYKFNRVEGPIVFDPDSNVFYVNSSGRILRLNIDFVNDTDELWRLKSLDFGTHGNLLSGLVFSDDGRFLYAAGFDKSADVNIFRRELETGEATLMSFRLRKSGYGVRDIAMLEGNRLLATLKGLDGDDQVVIVDLNNELQAPREVLSQLQNPKIVPTQQASRFVLFTATVDGVERPVLYDSQTDMIVSTGPDGMRAVTISSDGTHLVAVDIVGQTVLFDRNFQEVVNLGKAVGGVTFSADEKKLWVYDSIGERRNVLKLDGLDWDSTQSSPFVSNIGHQRWFLNPDETLLFALGQSTLIHNLSQAMSQPDQTLVEVSTDTSQVKANFTRPRPDIRMLGGRAVTSIVEGQVSDTIQFALNVSPAADMFLNVLVPAESMIQPSRHRLSFTKDNWLTPQELSFFVPIDDLKGASREFYDITFEVGIIDENGQPRILTQKQHSISVEYRERQLSGFVWDDTNQNGQIDSFEKHVDGVTVDLMDDEGSIIASVSTSAQPNVGWGSGRSAANGYYDFGDLQPGNYVLKVTGEDNTSLPSSTTSEMSVEITEGENEYSVDIGLLNDTLLFEEQLVNSKISVGEQTSVGNLSLRHAIVSDVVVQVRSSWSGLDVIEQQHVFTPENWFMPREVQVELFDADFVPSGARLDFMTTEGGSRPNQTETVLRTIDVELQEKAPTQIVVSADQILLHRSGSSTLQVRLSKPPSTTVNIVLEPSDNSMVIVDQNVLTFSSDDWDEPQDVTIRRPTNRYGYSDGFEAEHRLLLRTTGAENDPIWQFAEQSEVTIRTYNSWEFDLRPVQLDDAESEQDIYWFGPSNAVAYEIQVVRLSCGPKVIYNQLLWPDQTRLKLPLPIGNYRVWGRVHYQQGVVSDWDTEFVSQRFAPELKPLDVDAEKGHLTVSWDAVPGAAQYRIFARNKGYSPSAPLIDEYVTGTEITFFDLDQSGSIDVWVQAIGEDGLKSRWSQVRRHAYRPQIIPSAVPSTSPRPTLRWTPMRGATSYQVHIRHLATGGEYRILDVSEATYTVSESLAEGTYHWWVRVLAPSPNEQEWSYRQTFEVRRRTTIESLEGSDGNSTPLLKWPGIDTAASYDLFLQSQEGDDIIEYQGVEGTQLQLAPLTPGTYRVWVRTNDTDGTWLWGESRSITVSAAPGELLPTDLESADFAVNGQPELGWSADGEAASFDVVLRKGHDIRVVKQLGTHDFTPEEKLSPGNWQWAVRAVDSQGRSGAWVWGRPIDTTGRSVLRVPESFAVGQPIEFQWLSPGEAVRFQLQVDDLTSGTQKVIRIEDLTKSEFSTNQSLASGTYRVWVRAILSNGVAMSWSRRVDFEVQ